MDQDQRLTPKATMVHEPMSFYILFYFDSLLFLLKHIWIFGSFSCFLNKVGQSEFKFIISLFHINSQELFLRVCVMKCVDQMMVNLVEIIVQRTVLTRLGRSVRV